DAHLHMASFSGWQHDNHYIRFHHCLFFTFADRFKFRNGYRSAMGPIIGKDESIAYQPLCYQSNSFDISKARRDIEFHTALLFFISQEIISPVFFVWRMPAFSSTRMEPMLSFSVSASTFSTFPVSKAHSIRPFTVSVA